MSARSPDITLNNRVQMPAIGLGVFQTPPAETVGAVEGAIATGYRLIDTAAAYANEREVGEGIRRSGIARDDVFIETKIWISDYGYDSTLHAFDKSARKLGVERQVESARQRLMQQQIDAVDTELAGTLVEGV